MRTRSRRSDCRWRHGVWCQRSRVWYLALTLDSSALVTQQILHGWSDASGDLVAATRVSSWTPALARSGAGHCGCLESEGDLSCVFYFSAFLKWNEDFKKHVRIRELLTLERDYIPSFLGSLLISPEGLSPPPYVTTQSPPSPSLFPSTDVLGREICSRNVCMIKMSLLLAQGFSVAIF